MKKTIVTSAQATPITAPSEITPLAEMDIDQLVSHVGSMFGADDSQDGRAVIRPPFGHGSLEGWRLAQGIDLLRLQVNLDQPRHILRTAELNTPLWSFLLTDSPHISAHDESAPSGTHPLSPQGMAYAYNHHIAMNMLFENTGPLRMLLIRIKPEAWQQTLINRPAHIDQFLSPETPRFYGFNLQAQLGEDFMSLYRSCDEHNPRPWQTLIRTLQICSTLFEHLGQRSPLSTTRLNNRDAQRIYRAQQLLTADFQQPVSIPDISQQVGLGRDKMRQLFQQVYGTTPYQYFQLQRMNEARRLLLEENLSAMEVGYRVGYSHLGHFAKAFKKQFACLPKDIRKQQ